MNHSPFAVIGDTFWWQMRKPKIGANLDKNFSKKIFTTFATPVTGFNITHRCQHHIYKEGNSNLVHTTNININTEIVLFGGKCPTPQTGL